MKTVFVRLVLASVLGAGLVGASAASELNVVSWDGAYVKSQILGFIRPWEEKTGNRINVIHYDGGIEQIRRQVRAWNVQWDVVDLELFDAIRACEEGLLERLDHNKLPPAPDGTPATADFLAQSLTPCGVGNVIGSTVVAYNQQRLKQAPTQLEDFFDLHQWPGKRGLRRTPQGTLEWALMADGVAPSDVYQVLATQKGLQRAFTVLDGIKPNIIWWRTGQEAVRLLETGQAAMSAVYSGRISDARERGQPLQILWDHQVWYYDVWGIPKNGRNAALARDFIRFATSTESLAAQARYIPYGPMRQSSMALLDDTRKAQLPTAPGHLKTALQLDALWWSEHLEAIQPQFEQWLERPVRVPKAMPR